MEVSLIFGILKAAKATARTTVIVEADITIVGVGDSASKKDSEKLAALSAVYQLHEAGMVCCMFDQSYSHSNTFVQLDMQKSKPSSASPSLGTHPGAAMTAKLSDGTIVTYERARQFMDYYCRRYGFGRPEINFEEIRGKRGQNSTWETVITVDGRRIGLGTGPNKKAAQISSYLDVTQYLESCDTELWKTFVEAAKSGKDLGMAPKVFFEMSDGLNDEIRDLCYDMRKSTLYRNYLTSSSRRTSPSVPTDPPRFSFSRGRSSPRYLAEKSAQLLQHHQAYLVDPKQKTMRETRASLPVYTRSEEIITHVRNHDVTICMAATGSGKTTQIPQLILDDYIQRGQGAHCNILCTQPRRIAAVSVADRVAKERGETVGQGSVGYQVRFEAQFPEEHGSITFCTTGIFLKRMQSALTLDSGGLAGSKMGDVTHVIVDEVHERDVDTDLLLVVLKRLMASRKAANKPIKIVLMSATIDPTLFQKYFPDDTGQPAKVLEIPGRSFPVTKYFLEDFLPQLVSSRQTNWVFEQDIVAKYLKNELGVAAANLLPRQAALTTDRDSDRLEDLELPYPFIALTISHVLQKTDSGHVLVFLPGWEEITSVQRSLLNPMGPLGVDFNNTAKYSIHLLHSSIPLAEQQVIFEPPLPGVRRIILATNIAETSVTIPDVVYVIDTGRIKEKRYDPDRHMSSIVSAWVGSSNLNQRAGRAGRHRSGEYFGILGQKRADELQPYQTVEMKRVDLSNVVMHVKALDFPGMTVEEVLAATIEPPAAERVQAAMRDLQMVGALDDKKNLTSLGRVLLQLPVEVQMGRLVLFGSFFRCLDQALTLAAILTNRDPFVSPMHLKVEASQKKISWTTREFRSDALATLKAYNTWWAMQSKGQYQSANRFCTDNFLSKSTLLMIQKIKGHLLQSLYHAGVIDVSAGGSFVADGHPSSNSRNTTVPPELDANGYSLPLLAALIAIASQPKFAIRTGEKVYRTAQDKVGVVFIPRPFAAEPLVPS
jgi:small subunit ribosomal protein S24e